MIASLPDGFTAAAPASESRQAAARRLASPDVWTGHLILNQLPAAMPSFAPQPVARFRAAAVYASGYRPPTIPTPNPGPRRAARRAGGGSSRAGRATSTDAFVDAEFCTKEL